MAKSSPQGGAESPAAAKPSLVEAKAQAALESKVQAQEVVKPRRGRKKRIIAIPTLQPEAKPIETPAKPEVAAIPPEGVQPVTPVARPPAATGTTGQKMTGEITLKPEESEALRITSLKGVENRGDGVFFVPEKLMTPARRKAIQRGGDAVQVKPWSDVTGVPSDRGYAILDRRERIAARAKPIWWRI
jgi:hypothetical protein